MSPSIPSNEVGIVIRDPKFQLGQEIRQALKEKKTVLLKFRRKWGKPQK